MKVSKSDIKKWEKLAKKRNIKIKKQGSGQ
jgi:hypothetical protein